MSRNTKIRPPVFLIFCLAFYLAGYGQKKIVFRDRFCDNKKSWDLKHSDDFSVNIKKSALRFEKKTKNSINNYCLWFKKVIPGLKTEQNLSIAFKAVLTSWDDIVNNFNIQWGSIHEDKAHRDQTQFYQLDFSTDKVRLACRLPIFGTC